MSDEKKLLYVPHVNKHTDFWWTCPKCHNYQEVEFEGDSFGSELECKGCGEIFNEYTDDL